MHHTHFNVAIQLHIWFINFIGQKLLFQLVNIGSSIINIIPSSNIYFFFIIFVPSFVCLIISQIVCIFPPWNDQHKLFAIKFLTVIFLSETEYSTLETERFTMTEPSLNTCSSAISSVSGHSISSLYIKIL